MTDSWALNEIIHFMLFTECSSMVSHPGPDAHQPEALPEQSDGQSSHGQTEVGTRVQRLPRLGRRLHEPAGVCLFLSSFVRQCHL